MRIRRSKLDTTNPQSEIRNPQFEREAYGTKMLPDPLFPSLVAVTSADPVPTARITAVWPNAPSIRATEESFTVHDTDRPEGMFPLASRRVAKKLTLSPAATVSADGVTSTVATESPGGGGGGNESTTSSAVPLFPWLLAVTVVLPRRRARRMTDCPSSPSLCATVGSATLHLTLASLAAVPAASRRSAKNPALSPTATVADSGETVTDATGPGLRPGIESPEESTAAASPSGRPAPSRSLQAATASAVAANAAVRTAFMRFLRECVRTGYPGLLVPRHISRRPVPRHSRSDLPFTLRIPHSTFRIAMTVQAIAWSPSGAVRIVDQRALPEAKIERDLESGEAVADAIRTLQLRGAPLIGIAAAMGLVAGMRELRAAPRDRFLARLDELARLLAATRPTAVNLRWALDRMARVAAETPESWGGSGVWERLQAEATAIWEEDRAMCRRIGEAGLPLIPDGAKVLTHCNAGALATGGIGTALAPLYLAHDAGRRVHVFVDETRPVLQGARLTAWELVHAGIPCTVIADAVAGSLMRQAQVDLVIVGADRIAANGDFANKIGTYSLAVLALHHGVPFYCAAPSTTIDPALADGDGIPIEQRGPEEVKTVAGRPVAPAAAAALNPAFDVTPARYVSGFVTDRGLEQPPFGDAAGRGWGAPSAPRG